MTFFLVLIDYGMRRRSYCRRRTRNAAVTVTATVAAVKTSEACRCSDDDAASALLDSRLVLALVVWTTLLSLVICVEFALVACDRAPRPPATPPRLRPSRVPSLAQLQTPPVSAWSTLDTSVTGQLDTSWSADSQSVTWLHSLRDENWTLYPAAATIISHR